MRRALALGLIVFCACKEDKPYIICTARNVADCNGVEADAGPRADASLTDTGPSADANTPDASGADAALPDAAQSDGGASTIGTIALILEADAPANDVVVSLGVPFAPNTLSDETRLVLRNTAGDEQPAYVRALARWPQDGSIRSALVAFRASLANGAEESWSIEYGVARTRSLPVLPANPDGPIAARLEPEWYAASKVIGPQLSQAQNRTFAAWETEIEQYFNNMNPAWETYTINCSSTNAERTYYDSPHALFQRFIHRGTLDSYRRARVESVWYRANELTWFSNNEVAVYSCVTNFDPAVALPWGVLRRMLGQGMLDDFLLTGDPEAERAVKGLGEAFLRNLDALTNGNEVVVRVTERNMAWPMMGLASYYAVDSRPAVRQGLDRLVQMTAEWQAAGTSGAFEHDLVRPDPEECGDGPRGGSPFMTSLLIDGLMDTYFLTGDARIPPVITAAATWYRDRAITGDGNGFQYLWGCNDTNYNDPGNYVHDLNLLISHVFGAAYYVSRDDAWLEFGDHIADQGIQNIYAGRPKQWSQSTRTFLKYLGYRAEGRAP